MMRKYSRFLTISAAVVFAFAAVGCSKKTVSEPTTQESTETTTDAQTEPTTTTEAQTETETPVALEDRYHMLQGTVTKAADDGSVFTLQADDGASYDLHVVQIRDVEVDLSPDSQIAIAYIGDELGADGTKPEDVDFVVALAEQEEWMIQQAEGTTLFNAMSSFTIETADGEELSLVKDNCPVEEGALTKDSGDEVSVVYVSAGETNFPLEVSSVQ